MVTTKSVTLSTRFTTDFSAFGKRGQGEIALPPFLGIEAPPLYLSKCRGFHIGKILTVRDLTPHASRACISRKDLFSDGR